ncbi:MAG TPA: protein translocase subunit SecF [Bryobacteraceae bacterium]|nr:protein translocase subunit SecF [Bryobacteraceae bacterium]
MELFKNTNYDFLGKKWPFIGLSLLLTAAGLVSLAVNGGPRYGIDFRGGALMYLKFAEKPPVDKIRATIGAKIPIDVQEVTSSPNEIIIGTEVKSDAALNAARRQMVESLEATFNTGGGKLDLNNRGANALADRLREPLQKASVALSDQQVLDLAKAITQYRDTPPRSGLIRNVDELSSVSGVTPQILNVLKQEVYPAPFTVRQTEVVGPKIGGDLRRQAVWAVLYALGGMLVYIAFRFEWIYGLAAVIAVFHDTIITIGLFSMFHKEISLTVVAALLTLVGYSMNDTIVIFDRVRENLKLSRREPLEQIVNRSVNQTLSRTVLTSGLTFLTAISLFLFGGQVLNGFSFALVVGIIVGTYSSVFIASPIVIFWHKFADKRRSSPSTKTDEPVRKSTVKVK